MKKKILSLIMIIATAFTAGCGGKAELIDITEYTQGANPAVYGTHDINESLLYEFEDVPGWEDYSYADCVEKVGNVVVPMGSFVTLGQLKEIILCQCVDMALTETTDKDGYTVKNLKSHEIQNVEFWVEDCNKYGFLVEATIVNDTGKTQNAEDCHVYVINGINELTEYPGLAYMKENFAAELTNRLITDDIMDYLEAEGFVLVYYDEDDDLYEYSNTVTVTGYDGKEVCIVCHADLAVDDEDPSICYPNFSKSVLY